MSVTEELAGVAQAPDLFLPTGEIGNHRKNVP